MNAPRLILILLVLSGFVFAVNVNSCQNIGVSGVYDLTNNLAGEPTAAGDIFVGWNACLKVSASDVVIDCHGYTITGTTRSDTMGIGLLAGRNNVTIRNCPNITNYDNGIYVRSSSDIAIHNTTLYDNDEGLETFSGGNLRILVNNSRAIKNTWAGFDFYQDDYVTVTNCTAEDTYIGYSCQFCEHGTFTNNIGRDQTNPSLGGYAVQEYGGYNNTWEDNVFYNNYYFAFYVSDGENITVRNNTIYNNTQYGIRLTSNTNYSLFEDNTIYTVGTSGFQLDGGANNNQFVGNDVNGSIWGYYMASGSYNNTFTGNNATNTTQPGFKIVSSTGNVLEDNLVYSASVGFSITGNNNTVDGNTVNDCASGIEVEGVTNNIVRNNNVWDIGNQGYWSLGGATDSVFINNTAQNTSIGFEIYGSDNYLADNTAYGMSGFYGNGFHVFGTDDVYENNTAYNNANSGFFIAYTSDVNLSDNIAYGNDRGIHIQNVNNTRLSGDRMYDNNDDLYVNGSSAMQFFASNIIFDRAAGDFTDFTNLSITDVSAIGAPTVYSVDWSSNSTVPPTPSFEGKLVDITAITSTSPIDTIVWHWTDAESAAYNEATFVILKYNGSWNDEGAALNTGANTLTLTNVNPASDYGIFGTSGSGTPLSACQLINSPGNYSVTGSFSGTTSNYWYGTYTTCVLVQNTANVTIDCNNYTITETGGGSGAPIGIRNSTNVTVMNCNLTGARGLGMYQADYNTIVNNEFHANWALTGVSDNLYNNFSWNELYPGTYGFFGIADASYYGYNNVYGPSSSGFYLGGENSTVEHNNVFDSGYVGYAIASGAGGNNFTNNTAQNSSDHGFRVEGSGNRLIDNWALDSGQYGFFIEHGDDNYVDGCVAQFNGMDGFRIDDAPLMGTNNTIANSLSQHNAGSGFSVFYSSYDQFINCTAYNNSLDGFFLDYSNNTNITDCNATDNGMHGIEMNNSNNNIVDPSYSVGNSLTGMTIFNSSSIQVLDSFFISNTNHGIELAGDTYDCLIDNNVLMDSGTSLIEVQGSSNDNNFTNNRLNGTLWGVYAASGTENNTFRGNNATNTTQASFKIVAPGNVLENNMVYSASVGFSVNGNNNTIDGNTVNDCASGIEVEGATDTIVRHNQVWDIGNQGYWSLGGATDSVFINNTAQNTSIGFEIYGSDNYLADNTAYDNTGFYGNGFHVFGTDDVYENNTAYNNANSGFFIAYTSDVNLSDNLAYGNSEGILVQGVNNTRLVRDRMYGNTYDLYLNGSSAMDVYASNIIFDSAGGALTNFTNLSLTDTLVASSQYTIDWDSQPAALPGAYIPFENKWADISTQAGAVSIDSIIWHWTDAEAASYDEGALEIMMYDGSWNSLNDTPDTGSNELSLYNLNPASTYGIAMLNASTCMEITSPGAYQLINNLTGAPFDTSETPWSDPINACIKIASSDVVVDCNGYSITNNGTVSAAAILVNGTSGGMLDNITVRNCNLEDYLIGFLGWYVTNGLVEDNNASNMSWMGFQFNGGNTDSMLRNRVTLSQGGFGIDVAGTGNTVQDNYAQNSNLSHGTVAYWFNMSDTLVDNNTAIGFYRSFRFNMGENNTVTDNVARNGGTVGFLVSNNYSNFSGNTAYNFPQACYRLDPVAGGPNYPTYNNTLSANAAWNCSVGFDLYQAHNNTIQDSSPNANTQNGVRLLASNGNILRRIVSYGNAVNGVLVNSSNGTFVDNCTARNNNYEGFWFTNFSIGSVVDDSYGYSNTREGFYWSTNSTGSTVTDSVAHSTVYPGFHFDSGCGGNDIFRNTVYNIPSDDGFYFDFSHGNNFSHNFMNAIAGDVGAVFYYSDDNYVYNNTCYFPDGGCLYFSGDNNTVLENFANLSQYTSFYFLGDNNTILRNRMINGWDTGITSYGNYNEISHNYAENMSDFGYDIYGDYHTGQNNTACNNPSGSTGISIGGDYNTFTDLLSYNSGYGFWLYNDYNDISNITTYGNEEIGVYLDDYEYSNLSDFTSYDNGDYALYVEQANNSVISDAHLYNSGINDLYVEGYFAIPLTYALSNITFDNPSGGFVNHTSLSITDVLGPAEQYFVNWTMQPAALPGGVDPFENKWVAIDNSTPGISLDSVVWRWTDAEAASYDESLLEVWKHDGVDYSRTGATLNQGANTLTINNFNPASDYGIVENNITYCMDITSSGLYMLNNDLAGAPISASPRPGTTCIRVSASDVIVDCDGYTIANNGTGGTTRAIFATSGLDNVTVRNCNLEDYTINLEYYQADDGFIDNTTSYDSVSYGFYLNYADNNTVTGCVADTSGTHGFFTDDATYNNLTNNTARNIGSNGIYISPNSHNSYVRGNIVHNTSSGYYIQASQYCMVRDNIAYDNSRGFLIWTNFYGSAFYNQFINNTAYDNSNSGFYALVNRNNFTSNTAFDNQNGFEVSLGQNNFVDNEAYNNTATGFYAVTLTDSVISGLRSYSNGIFGIRNRNSEDNLYIDSLLYDNPRDIEVDNGGGSSYWFNMTNTTFREPGGSATNQTSMSMNDSVPTTTSNYRISWSAQPAALPGNYSSFAGKFVEIVEAVGSVSLDSVAFHWDAAESAGVDESYFRLLHHDGSWNEVPGQVLDEANNEITATNVNDFSVYGIIMYNDTNVSALKLEQSFAVPSQGGVVEFNITVANTGNVTLDPVEVIDVLPAGLTYSAASPAPDNVAGQTLTWDNAGPIGPGSAATIMVNATVDYGYSGILTNYVNVTGQPPLGDNVTAEDYENVTAYTANISVLKVDMTPLVVSPGGLVEWLINISNPGGVDLDPVMVSDTLPAGFAYDAASPAADSTAGPIVWNNVGPIANGSSVQIYMNTTVGSGVLNGTYYNFVEVEGMPLNGDNVTDNDTAMVGIYAPGISITKSAEYASVMFGQNVTYILTITNTGSVEVNLTVQDILPGNMTFEAATVAPSSVAGQTVTWDNYMVLPVGNATEITYNASVNVTGIFDNNVTVWAVPPNGDNVTDNDSVTVYVTDEEDTDPKPEPKSFTVSFKSNCEGNTVKVLGASPSSGFQVFVDKASSLEEIASGTTDSDGEFTFAGCGLDLRILVKKSDYSSQTVYKTMIPCVDCELECGEDDDCEDNEQCENNFCESVSCACGTISDHQCTKYECCLDSDCEAGQSCEGNVCTFECASDDDCSDTQYCDIAEGASGGSCEDVSGMCGFAENHTWAVYECGDEEGCPECPERYVCQDNVCEPVLDLIGPKSGFVGEDVTVSATEAENACVNCQVRILLPDGTSLTGKTDSRGQLKVPLNFEGPYELTLFEEGVPVKSIQVNSLAKPSVTPEETPTQVIDEAASLFLVVLLALLLVAIVYWRRRRSRKK